MIWYNTTQNDTIQHVMVHCTHLNVMYVMSNFLYDTYETSNQMYQLFAEKSNAASHSLQN